jgi:hypothetical protein
LHNLATITNLEQPTTLQQVNNYIMNDISLTDTNQRGGATEATRPKRPTKLADIALLCWNHSHKSPGILHLFHYARRLGVLSVELDGSDLLTPLGEDVETEHPLARAGDELEQVNLLLGVRALAPAT